MEKILIAVIASITSLTVSLITLGRYLITEKRLTQEFRKTRSRNSTEKLIDLRLEKYPEAFEITDKIVKVKGDQFDRDKLLKVKKELLNWKTGITRMVISNESYTLLMELNKALSKEKAFEENYSQEQVDKIWKLRRQFRGSLRGDVGILHSEDENRINS